MTTHFILNDTSLISYLDEEFHGAIGTETFRLEYQRRLAKHIPGVEVIIGPTANHLDNLIVDDQLVDDGTTDSAILMKIDGQLERYFKKQLRNR